MTVCGSYVTESMNFLEMKKDRDECRKLYGPPGWRMHGTIMNEINTKVHVHYGLFDIKMIAN